MPNSKRFKQLQSRINDITKHLLPKTKLSGNYTKEEQDKIRGYLLLIHAEIESFFEERVESKVNTAFRKWQIKRQKSNILLSVMAFRNDEISYAPFRNNKDIEARIEKAKNSFTHFIRVQNHGIKEENILNLLLPLGIEESQIDNTWLSTMENFGKSRGRLAHSTAKTQQPLDPITEQATINLIMTEIEKIDLLINKLI